MASLPLSNPPFWAEAFCIITPVFGTQNGHVWHCDLRSLWDVVFADLDIFMTGAATSLRSSRPQAHGLAKACRDILEISEHCHVWDFGRWHHEVHLFLGLLEAPRILQQAMNTPRDLVAGCFMPSRQENWDVCSTSIFWLIGSLEQRVNQQVSFLWVQSLGSLFSSAAQEIFAKGKVLFLHLLGFSDIRQEGHILAKRKKSLFDATLLNQEGKWMGHLQSNIATSLKSFEVIGRKQPGPGCLQPHCKTTPRAPTGFVLQQLLGMSLPGLAVCACRNSGASSCWNRRRSS